MDKRANLVGTFLLSTIVTGYSGDILRPGVGVNGPTAVNSFGATPATSTQIRSDAQNSLARVTEAINAVRTMEQTARNIARGVNSSVPNGLVPGGMQVATGANALWIGAGKPQQSVVNGFTQVTIQQTAPQAILNWQTFNLGANTIANFDQSAGGRSANSWVALNRILDPTNQPSRILGSLRAQGQVYLINRNGIIFGGGSQVNVAALIASSADFSGGNAQFLSTGIYNGALNSAGQPLPSFSGAGGNIMVEAGAQISTNAPISVLDAGGYILLMGLQVQNAGTIVTSDGQTGLAAGQDFIVRPGFGTDGNSNSTTRGNEVAVTGGGLVSNTGLIQATTGDISLVGKNVVQAGVALSTSSVAQRGTIHLLSDTNDPTSSVTLSPGSLTYIALDDAGTFPASNAQRGSLIAASLTRNQALASKALLNDQSLMDDLVYESRIEIVTGGTVDFENGSTLVAHGGQIAVNGGVRILAATGSLLDVSGLLDVLLPMSSNDLTVNVQGFELRDASLNRDTKLLNNSNLYVDLRTVVEVPASAAYSSNRYYTAGGLLEVSGELNNVTHSIQEWGTLGGTITLSTGNTATPQTVSGAVVAQPGALFDIAGGSVQFQAGYLQQSYLIGSDGRIYNVNTAPAGIAYFGVFQGFIANHPRWGITDRYGNVITQPSQIYEAGYTVGRDAGNLVNTVLPV